MLTNNRTCNDNRTCLCGNERCSVFCRNFNNINRYTTLNILQGYKNYAIVSLCDSTCIRK